MPPPSTQFKDEPEEDTSSPIVVSERCLKRKVSSKASEGSNKSAKSISGSKKRVKQEDIPSSPLQPVDVTHNPGNIVESLDLDEVGGTLRTPRKRLRLEAMMRGSNLTAGERPSDDQHYRIQENNEDVSAGAHEVDRVHEPLQAEAHNTKSMQQTELDKAQPSLWVAFPSQKTSHHQDNHEAAPVSSGSHHDDQTGRKRKDIFDVPSSSPGDRAQLLPRTSAANSSTRRRSNRSDHGVAAIPMVAEDGESVPQSPTGGRKNTKPADPSDLKAMRAGSFHSRLGKLLDGSSSPKSPMKLNIQQLDTPRLGVDRVQGLKSLHTLRSTLVDGSSSPKSALKLNIERPTGTRTGLSRAEGPKSLHTPRSVPPVKSSNIHEWMSNESAKSLPPSSLMAMTYNGGHGPNYGRDSENIRADFRKKLKVPKPLTTSSRPDSPTPINPDSEPLRARPLATLNLTDFRLNPSYTDLPYAHHESLRRHDEKAGRTGCTDPHCARCASLTAFAISTLSSLPPLSPTSEAKLLRSYLGPSAPLPTPGTESRKELLEKARVQDYKDKHGKHRQTFSRAVEPPGFWDADFPDTQRREELGKMANEVERKKVEERWREAMKSSEGGSKGKGRGKGGMWVFADEVERGARR